MLWSYIVYPKSHHKSRVHYKMLDDPFMVMSILSSSCFPVVLLYLCPVVALRWLLCVQVWDWPSDQRQAVCHGRRSLQLERHEDTEESPAGAAHHHHLGRHTQTQTHTHKHIYIHTHTYTYTHTHSSIKGNSGVTAERKQFKGDAIIDFIFIWVGLCCCIYIQHTCTT